jgi:hypothetical protein
MWQGPNPVAASMLQQKLKAGLPPTPAPAAPPTPGTEPWKAPTVTELPQLNAVAMKMLGDKLKAGLPVDTQAPAAPAPAPQIDPLNLPSSITKSAKNLMGGMAKVQEIREKTQAQDAVSRLPSPLVEDAPLDVTQNPQIGKRASQLVSAAKALQKYTGADVAEKEQAQAEAQAAREEKSQAQAQVRAQRDADRKAEKDKSATERAQALAERAKMKAEAAATKAVQVKERETAKAELVKAKLAAKAAADKVRATKSPAAPKAAPEATQAPDYEPFAEEHLYPKGISPKQYAELEAAKNGTDNDVYKVRAERSEARRQNTARDLKAKFPKEAHVIDWLQRELQRVGTSPTQITRAVKYAQDNVSDDLAKALEAFK